MAATNANFLQRATQSAWVRPVLFLVLLVVLWDVAIRIFRIPPYQIPKPADVLLTFGPTGHNCCSRRCRLPSRQSRVSCSRRYSASAVADADRRFAHG